MTLNRTAQRAIAVATGRYLQTRGHRPVDSGEVFWDSEFRLSVALYDAAGLLLAVYRITREDGIMRAATRLPRTTRPFTLDNEIILGQINAAAEAADSAAS